MKAKCCQGGYIRFYCPGCDSNHVIPVTTSDKNNWQWNNSLESPTLYPSILDRGKRRMTEEEYQRAVKGETIQLEDTVCHSWVTNGRIQFLSDCTHSLKDQTVELPEIYQTLGD